MKKIAIFLISSLILLFIVIIYLVKSSSSTISHELSLRAQEYIKHKAKEGTGEWNKNLVSTNSAGSKEYKVVTSCFTFTLPSQPRMTRKDEECNHYIYLGKTGSVVVFERPFEGQRLADSGDIIMRRFKPEKYLEKSIEVNGKQFVTFHNKDLSGQVNIFYLHNGKLLTISITLEDKETALEYQQKILDSLIIYNE